VVICYSLRILAVSTRSDAPPEKRATVWAEFSPCNLPIPETPIMKNARPILAGFSWRTVSS